MLTDALRVSRRSRPSSFLIDPASVMPSASKPRVVSGMRPTGRLHLGHLVGALGNWVPLQDQYDCFYFVADWHALTSDFADTEPADVVRLRQRRRLDWRRPRSREEHVLRPVARARARRALPAAVDGRAGAVARARADLQGAAGDAEGQGSVVDRLSRLSAAADGRRRDLRRAASCRSARIRWRISSCRAKSCGASTTSSATSSSSRSRC